MVVFRLSPDTNDKLLVCDRVHDTLSHGEEFDWTISLKPSYSVYFVS
jgi:hypothetical protein